MKICLFADVYGFSAMVAQSSAEVAEQLQKLLDYTKEHFSILEQGISKIDTDGVSSAMLYIFSDNIIVAFEISDALAKQKKHQLWGCFQMFCADIYQQSFDVEMPLRGCISAGDIEFAENVVVGTSIIEAVAVEKRIGLPIIFIPKLTLERIYQDGAMPRRYFEDHLKFVSDFEFAEGVLAGFPILPQSKSEMLQKAEHYYQKYRVNLNTTKPAKMWKKLITLIRQRNADSDGGATDA